MTLRLLPGLSARVRALALAVALPALLIFAACGGDDDSAAADPPTADPSATVDPSVAAEGDASPTPRPTRGPAPSPTPVAEDGPLFFVSFGENVLRPIAADLAALEQTEINGVSGVSLATLAAQVEAAAESTIDIQGLSSGGGRTAIARGTLAELGETTIVVVEAGRARLVSTFLDEGQQFDTVLGIAIQ